MSLYITPHTHQLLFTILNDDQSKSGINERGPRTNLRVSLTHPASSTGIYLAAPPARTSYSAPPFDKSSPPPPTHTPADTPPTPADTPTAEGVLSPRFHCDEQDVPFYYPMKFTLAECRDILEELVEELEDASTANETSMLHGYIQNYIYGLSDEFLMKTRNDDTQAFVQNTQAFDSFLQLVRRVGPFHWVKKQIEAWLNWQTPQSTNAAAAAAAPHPGVASASSPPLAASGTPSSNNNDANTTIEFWREVFSEPEISADRLWAEEILYILVEEEIPGPFMRFIANDRELLDLIRNAVGSASVWQRFEEYLHGQLTQSQSAFDFQ